MSIRPVFFVVALHKAVDLLFKVLKTEVGKDSFIFEIFLFEVKHLVFKTYYYNDADALNLLNCCQQITSKSNVLKLGKYLKECSKYFVKYTSTIPTC